MAVLDSTALIDLMRGKQSVLRQRVVAKLEEIVSRGDALRTTIFNVAELLVGVHKGNRPAEERQKLDNCLADLEILPFSELATEIFGMVVADLEQRGEPIGDIDALIAAVTLENRDFIVTRNIRHFDRVPGLSVETY